MYTNELKKLLQGRKIEVCVPPMSQEASNSSRESQGSSPTSYGSCSPPRKDSKPPRCARCKRRKRHNKVMIGKLFVLRKQCEKFKQELSSTKELMDLKVFNTLLLLVPSLWCGRPTHYHRISAGSVMLNVLNCQRIFL